MQVNSHCKFRGFVPCEVRTSFMSSPFSKQRVKNVCLRRCGVTSKSIQRSTDPYRAFFVGSVFLLFTHSHIERNDERVIAFPSALAITNIDCDSAFSFLSSASSTGVIGRSRILQSVFRCSLSVELVLATLAKLHYICYNMIRTFLCPCWRG